MELVESQGQVRIHVPLALKRRSGRKQVMMPEGAQPGYEQNEARLSYQDAMVIAFARAFRWKKLLDEGKYGSIAEMADALGINRWYMSRILRLTLIDPKMVTAIVDGTAPDGVSLEQLRKPTSLLWREQQELLQSTFHQRSG